MKRVITIVLMFLFAMGWGGQGSYLYAAEQGLVKDPYLDNGLKMILNKAQDEELTVSDLEKLTVIDLPSAGIRSLSGLEHAAHLTHLRIPYNQVEDLSPLQEITTLREVDVTNNYVSSIEPLEKNTEMERLIVSNNAITSLGVTGNFPRLHTLYAGGNQITSLDGLSGAASLRTLDINFNKIESVEPLVNMTSLKELLASSNQIKNISVLTQLPNLQILDLNQNQITDATYINKLPKSIVSLKLAYNPLSHINQLQNISHLTNLEVLDLSGLKLSSLNPLQDLQQLTNLNVSDNQITSLDPLKDLKSLTNLDVSKNLIFNLAPLQELNHIQSLDLASNLVWDLKPIQNQQFTYVRQESSGEPPYYGLNLKDNYLDLTYGSNTWSLFTELGGNPEDVTPQGKYQRLQEGSKIAYVGDKPYSLRVAPFIEKGRTYVPLRFISEQLGAGVTWDQTKKQVTIQKNDTFIQWTAGNRQVKVNDKIVLYDAPLMLKGGVTCIPLRFVSEQLGIKVGYINSSKTTLIFADK
ncbi:leucine-rich repeat domain-containing protein [Paenibacillus sp. Marseille-Q7038]